jgi:hypothetical protein
MQTAVSLPPLLLSKPAVSTQHLFIPQNLQQRRFTSTAFVLPDGRSPLNLFAIPNNSNIQPAPKSDRCAANWRWHNAVQGR